MPVTAADAAHSGRSALILLPCDDAQSGRNVAWAGQGREAAAATAVLQVALLILQAVGVSTCSNDSGSSP